jgi:MFS family permease
VTTAAAAAGSQKQGVLAAMHYRDYALFWWAAIISNSGTWMQTITVPFVIFQITHSTTWVGFAAFMMFGPAFIVGPIAGSLADRLPRKQVIMYSQTVMMVMAFALWGVWISGEATPWNIVVLLMVSGFASGVNLASWQSFVPQLVPHDTMMNAIRLNSMQFTAARSFGPALAGLVLAEFGAGAAFLINALTFVLVLVVLVMIHPRPVDIPSDPPTMLAHFGEGLRYVRRRRALVLSCVTITVLCLFGSSIVQLAAPLAETVFEVGEAEYGILVAAFGIGSVLGVGLLLAYGDRVRRSRMALVGLAGFAASEILLGAAPVYAVGLVALGGMGITYILVAVSLNTSIQARVDEGHRGRVLAIYLMGLLAGVPLGALLAGAMAEVIGLRATVIAAGAVLVGFLVLALVAFHGMRALDETTETEHVRPDPLLAAQPELTGAD